jgi:hypothetical protein
MIPTVSLSFIYVRPEQFVLESKKETDYSGMPDMPDSYEDSADEEDNLKTDSMGNTLESNDEEGTGEGNAEDMES